MNDKIIQRNIIPDIFKFIERKEILIIKGPRQSGKTTLLEMLTKKLIEERGVNPDNIIYLTFDNTPILESFEKDPIPLIRSFTLNLSGQIYILLDEIQRSKSAGLNLKLIYDTFKNIKFIATGSSSLEIESNIESYLVGRVFSYILLNFEFQEFLRTKPANFYNHYIEASNNIKSFITGDKFKEKFEFLFTDKFLDFLNEFITFGGYPEVVKTEQVEIKMEILRNIYETYLTKDIIETLQMGNVSSYRKLVLILANQIGNLTNYHSLLQDTGCYFALLKKYIDILENTYIIKSIKPFYINEANAIRKNPKIYFLDSGLRNSMLGNFTNIGIRPDNGQLIENYILTQLLKSYFKYGAYLNPEGNNVRFWRTTSGTEVDFVLNLESESIISKKQAQNMIPIEAKFSKITKPSISRSFRSYLNTYNPERALILTKDYFELTKINNTKLLFCPIWAI